MSTTIPIQTGTAIASDVVAGDVIPKTKIVFGANGAATDVTVDAPFPTKDSTVKTAIDSVKTSVDAGKTSTDGVKTSVDSVKTAIDKISSATDFASITPSDSTALSGIKGVYCGVEGNLVVVGSSGATVTFKVQAGQILPISPAKVTTATTASNLVALK